MKILLFGKNGQVGWELQRSLSLLGELVALDVNSGDLPADFSKPESLRSTVDLIRPNIIVNAAAHTAVDKAESEPDLVERINAVAPAVLAQAATSVGALLVHYSTDYVFDGEGSDFRTESSSTGPLNVYGQTKLAGENAVREVCPNHLIFRTSWVYGARGGNFAKTMLRLAGERERLTVIDDQIGAPTGADLLADITAHAVRDTVKNPGFAGTYHAVAGGETSWHGYASLVIDYARRLGVDLKTKQIDPVPTEAFPTPARRPRNSRLSTEKLQRNFGLALPAWQSGVERMLQEIIR